MRLSSIIDVDNSPDSDKKDGVNKTRPADACNTDKALTDYTYEEA